MSFTNKGINRLSTVYSSISRLFITLNYSTK